MPSFNDQWSNSPGVSGPIPNVHMNKRLNISQLDDYHGTPGYKRDAATANIGSTLGRGAFNIPLPGSGMSLGEAFLNKQFGVSPGSVHNSNIEMPWGNAILSGNTNHTQDTVYNFSFANSPRSEDFARRENQAFGYATGVGAQRTVFANFDRSAFLSSMQQSVGNFDTKILSNPTKLSDWLGQSESHGSALLNAYSSAYQGSTTYDYTNRQYRDSARSSFDAQVRKMSGGSGPSSLVPFGNARPPANAPFSQPFGNYPNSGGPGSSIVPYGDTSASPYGRMDTGWNGQLRLPEPMNIETPRDSIGISAISSTPGFTSAQNGRGRPSSAGGGSKPPNRPPSPPGATFADWENANPQNDGFNYDDWASREQRRSTNNDPYKINKTTWADIPSPEPLPEQPPSHTSARTFEQWEAEARYQPEIDWNQMEKFNSAPSNSPYISNPYQGKGKSSSRSAATAKPPASPDFSVQREAKAQGQIGAIGNISDDLSKIASSIGQLGAVSKSAQGDIEKAAQTYTNLSKVFQDADKLASSDSPLSSRAQSFLDKNANARGTLSKLGSQLFGDNGLYSKAVEASLTGRSESPDFREKLTPFLMGGRGGREARDQAFGKGWYGEEGSIERAAWGAAGTALGTANRALLGYRTIRHFGQELIDPLQNDALVYQQMESAKQVGLTRSGAVGIGQLSTGQQRLLDFQNARQTQQYNMGGAFQRAWLPAMQAGSGAAAGLTGELAGILGPSIAVGAGLSFIGQPELGLAAGLGAAGVGVASSIYSNLTDVGRLASVKRSIGTQSVAQSALEQGPLSTFSGLLSNEVQHGRLFGALLPNLQGMAQTGNGSDADALNRNIDKVFSGAGDRSLISSAESQGAYANFITGNKKVVQYTPTLTNETRQQGYSMWMRLNNGQAPTQANLGQFVSDTNVLGGLQQSGYDVQSQIANLPALKGGYGYMSGMIQTANGMTNGNFPLVANMASRAFGSAGFAQTLEQGYGMKNAGSVAASLYGGTDYYASQSSVEQASQLMFNYGMATDANGAVRKDATARRTGYSKVFAAGFNPEQLGQAYAANQGVDTLNAQAMGGMVDYGASRLQGMIDQGLSPAQIQSNIQRQSYTAGLNQYASQMGLGLINTQPFQNFTSQQSSFMQSVISGDTTANSIFADQVPGNEWRRTIQTGSRGGTKGMHAYYDEAITPEVRDDVAATGRERGYMRGDGRYSVNALAGTNQVQREQMQYKEEIRTRDYDFSLAQKQLTRSQASTTGVGLGAIVSGFEGKGQYYFEDQGISLNRAQQDFGYQQQGKQLDIQRQQMQYGFGYQQQQMNVQRSHQVTEQGWGLQDIAYQRSVSSMQYGFNMVDADENIRYARGRERRVAMRHRDEATIMHSMQTGQMDKEEERAKERIKWGDEQFNRDQQHFQQEKQFAEQNFNVQVENYRKQREFITQERQLEDQQRVLRRAINAIDMAEAKQSLDFHQLEKKTMDDLAGTSKVFNDRLTVMGAQVGFLPNQIQNANTALEAFSSHIAMVAQSAVSGGSYTPPPMQTYSGTSYQGIPIVSTGAARALLQGPVPQGTIGVPMQPVNHGSGAGYASGGYTGDGPSYQPAGTVHKREFVVPEHGALVSHNPELVELMKQQNGLLKQILSEGGNAMIMVTDKNVGQLSKKARSLVDEAYVQ